MTPYKLIKKRPKIAQNLICHGGVKIDENRPRGPRTPKTEFFEICHFFAKTFRKPTPINRPHKNEIPHKNACTRVKKSSKIGGPGADRSDRKL
jgi:hypothetical protein